MIDEELHEKCLLENAWKSIAESWPVKFLLVVDWLTGDEKNAISQKHDDWLKVFKDNSRNTSLINFKKLMKSSLKWKHKYINFMENVFMGKLSKIGQTILYHTSTCLRIGLTILQWYDQRGSVLVPFAQQYPDQSIL